MIHDRFRKKTKRPTAGGDASIETTDISDQVPQVDDVLAEVDQAIAKAENLVTQSRLRQLEKDRKQNSCPC